MSEQQRTDELEVLRRQVDELADRLEALIQALDYRNEQSENMRKYDALRKEDET